MSERLETDLTKNISMHQSSIENIDAAFYEYIEKLNLFCNTINGWSKVPVIWTSAERSYQIKNNKEIRDKNGSLIPPIISLERTNITKDPNKKGNFQSNVSPNNDRYYVTKLLNQQKTSEFANSDSLRRNGQINFVTSKKNNKKVYEHYFVRIPTYITVEYKIYILTNYQMQMNEILQPFLSRNAQSYFVIQKDDYRYESFMDQNFQQETLNLGEEERKYKTTINVKVLGYLIGEGANQEERNVKIIENPVDIKFTRESIVLESESKIKQISSQNIISKEELLKTFKKVFLIGNGVDSSYNIIHDLGSRDIHVAVRNMSTNDMEFPGIRFTGLNTVLLDFGIPIGINSYTVTIIS